MKEIFFLFCLSVRSNTIVLLFLKIPSKVESPIGLQVILGRKSVGPIQIGIFHGNYSFS